MRQYLTWTIYDPSHGDSPSDWMYTEGNYSCDCNRYIFFRRAIGHELTDEDHDAVVCSHNKFLVNLANAKDDVVYYREFE